VLPVAQVAHPDQFWPPHCPYFAVGVQLEDEVVGFVDVVVVVVVGDEVVTLPCVVVVVVGGALVEVDGEDPVPVPEAALHPTRLEATAISSYQNVLASPPYDSQPK